MNIGLLIIGLGVVMVIASGVLYYLFQKKNKVLSVHDFDKKFEIETTINPSRLEIASKRKEMAQKLNINDGTVIERISYQEPEYPEVPNSGSVETEKLI